MKTMNNTIESAAPKSVSRQLTMVAGVIRGFIVATFVAIALFPLVISATAATMV
jgi:hypothetical protein